MRQRRRHCSGRKATTGRSLIRLTLVPVDAKVRSHGVEKFQLFFPSQIRLKLVFADFVLEATQVFHSSSCREQQQQDETGASTGTWVPAQT